MAKANSKMLPASYKGVRFSISSDDSSGGRGTVIHQFPKRELPYVEDMGAAPRTFTIEAFVVGADYGQRRDALIAALNEPGPGTLAHPWLGELWVSQTGPYHCRHSGAQGSIAVFSLTFTQDSQPDSPASIPHLPSQVNQLATASGLLAGADLDSLCQLAGQGDEVLSATLDAAQNISSHINNILEGNFSQVALLAGDLLGVDVSGFMGMAAQAGNLSGLLGGLFSFGSQEYSKVRKNTLSGSSGAISSNPDTLPAVLSTRQYQNLAGYAQTPPPAVPKDAGVLRSVIAGNRVAVQTYANRMAVIEACRGFAAVTPAHKSQAQEIQAQIMDSVDLLLPLAGDDLAASLMDMRGLTLAALAGHTGSTPELITVYENLEMPSLVLAWKHCGNPALLSAEKDIISRNQAFHPGFVPAGSLEVLVP